MPKSLDERMVEEERNETLYKAVGSLPEIQRRRFLLYYEYEFNFYQIAAMEHCTASAIQKSVAIAKEKVKAEIEEISPTVTDTARKRNLFFICVGLAALHVYTGPKFAIDAIAAGKQGAISIHRFVQPHSSLTIGRNRNDFIELDKNDIKVETYDNSSRQIPGYDISVNTKHSFRDAKLIFTEEQVKAETARCLGCGASVVDQNKCIGCGICTTKCEFDAIKLHRELPNCSRMVPYEKRLKFVLPNMVKQSIKLKFKEDKAEE